MSAATTEQIAAIVNEVYKLWIEGEGGPHVTCAFDINSGPCGEFADHVVAVVQERFPETEIEVEDYADWLARDGLSSQSIHYYVRANGMVFDASRRDGVFSPDQLPTCHSIRICAARDDDVSDDLDDEEGMLEAVAGL